VSDVNFDQIGGLVMEELNRRLGSEELAQDLPGTLLMKVAMDYVKHLEARNAIEKAKLEQVRVDPLEMIDQAGLSLEQRIMILSEYLDDIETTWREASQRIVELLDQYREQQREREMVQELQTVGDGQ
jgi:hypothetical protein